MQRSEKEQAIDELRELFLSSEAILLTNPIGTDVNTINLLRSRCREEGITFRVVKNSLAKRALAGSDKEIMSSLFSGPTAVVLKAGDPVSPAKVISEFAEKNKSFEVKGGFLSGKVLDASGVEQLSKMQSIDELRASLLSLLQSGQTGFVGVTNALVTKVLRLLSARADQLEDGGSE